MESMENAVRKIEEAATLRIARETKALVEQEGIQRAMLFLRKDEATIRRLIAVYDKYLLDAGETDKAKAPEKPAKRPPGGDKHNQQVT